MKVEAFAEEILALVRSSRLEKLSNKWYILEKLKFSGDDSKVQSYWKVCQALSELGFNLLAKKAYSKSTSGKTMAVQVLFHAGRTTAVLRRLLRHRAKLFPSLHDLMHEAEDTPQYYETLNYILAVLYRCLLVGKLKDAQCFMSLPLLDDFYQIVAELTTTSKLGVLGYEQILVILRCTKIVELLAETGDDDIVMTLQKKEAVNKKLFRQLHTKIDLDHLKEISKHTNGAVYVSKLLDYKLKDPDSTCLGLATMPRSQRLEEVEFPNSMYLFCSSPDCRKLQSVGTKLQHCAACMLARYCSEECQKKHWLRGHKTQCQTIT